MEDFENLLKTLSQIEGKFLLSSYHSPVLDKYKREHYWEQKAFKSQVSVNKGGNGKEKTEVLTANYPIIDTTYATFGLFG